jgi:polyisoprenoid-binding protein YceI
MKKVILSLILLFILPTLTFSEEWHIKKSDDNLVKFISSTSLLDFEGVTNKIDGYIYWEGEKIFGANNELYFEVDLNTVETGIGKRDRDMREDVLETDKWPKTSFRGKIQNVYVIDTNSKHFRISSLGNMFIHGHNKELEIEALIKIDDGVMNITCNFSVYLNDYEIEAPSLLAFIKVAEEIKLQLNIQLEKIAENEN